jgi:alpha-pyrone synthase
MRYTRQQYTFQADPTMQAFITAIATASPKHKRSQTEAAGFIAEAMGLTGRTRKKLENLFANSGIDSRYSVLADYTKPMGDFSFFPNTLDFEPFPSTAERMHIYKNEALKLATTAVKKCAAKLKHFSLTNITHLITVSCTGMYTPGIDIELVQSLPLSLNTERTAINFMGCYGVFNGLKTANAICRADPNAKVLLVSVELCSLHLQKIPSMDNVISSAIFGDGAGAVIIESKASTTTPSLSLENFYCHIIPESNEQMTWHIGNTGFEMALSSYVPATIKSGIAEFCNLLLAKHQIKLSDIDLFAIHPGGKKILEACEESLGITTEDNRYAYEILNNYGNMSSATMLFVLEAIMRDINPEDRDKKIMGLGFGPGLTLESMLLRVS